MLNTSISKLEFQYFCLSHKRYCLLEVMRITSMMGRASFKSLENAYLDSVERVPAWQE